jgi:capsular polysaccharide biosynthesis protein
LVITGGTFGVYFTTHRDYVATSKVYVTSNLDKSTPAKIQESDKFVASKVLTITDLTKTSKILAPAINKSRVQISVAKLSTITAVLHENGSPIIGITVTYVDATKAANLANSIADALVSEVATGGLVQDIPSDTDSDKIDTSTTPLSLAIVQYAGADTATFANTLRDFLNLLGVTLLIALIIAVAIAAFRQLLSELAPIDDDKYSRAGNAHNADSAEGSAGFDEGIALRGSPNAGSIREARNALRGAGEHVSVQSGSLTARSAPSVTTGDSAHKPTMPKIKPKGSQIRRKRELQIQVNGKQLRSQTPSRGKGTQQ